MTLRPIAVAILAALALVLAACGGDDDRASSTTTVATAPSGPPIRIGTKDFTEQDILGELYKQALEARGFDVVLRRNIGSSELVHQALDNGVLDMYPEYVGVLLSEVHDVTERPSSADAAYRLARRVEEERGFTLLAQTPFSDANALAVTPPFAERHNLRSIGDLRRVTPRPTIGAPREFRTRFEGLIGLREVYGLRNLRYRVVQGHARYAALDSGEIDVGVVFTTERQLERGRYTVLDDPRNLFASGHVAPVINKMVLDAHGPRLREAIDGLSARLTTSAMRRMNGAVDIDGRSPRDVAAEFLRREGLV
jgi:osmoprotectant transport system substrate-binding protein